MDMLDWELMLKLLWAEKVTFWPEAAVRLLLAVRDRALAEARVAAFELVITS